MLRRTLTHVGSPVVEWVVVEVDTASQLEERARSLHAQGDYRGSLQAYEEAFAAYRDRGDLLAAARAARTVGWFRGWVFGEWAVYQGWAGQASRLLEQAGDPRAQGWIRFEQARRGVDLDAQRRLYLEAIGLGRSTGDTDLECDATASLGMMLVFSGLVEEGMAHLDQALAAICGGGVRELPVIEGCLCGLLNACERTQDVDRAQQWLGAADDVIRRGNLLAVAGYCRAHYAGILIAAGRWEDAESELRTAIDLLEERVALRQSAVCRLAELRVRQGRTEDAAQLLDGLGDHEDAAVPLVRLHLARDEPAVALELLDRLLANGELPDYDEGRLRALAVECLVRVERIDDARGHSTRMTALADGQSSAALRALAAAARANVCVASGDDDARSCWHEAITLFGTAQMPVEVAEARLGLAKLLAADRPDVALAEASAAFDVFDRVGAVSRADEAAALLRAGGAPARTGPKRNAGLTKREEEVLALVGHGLTNAEIGVRLFISAKTVEHHVGRLLAKLGLRSRTEAAAYAARQRRGSDQGWTRG
ncbi:MAG: LuxR C-terminal-related transcriptional regulator [Microthrixaceae bacterium]